MPNQELVVDVLAHIEVDLDRWNQAEYVADIEVETTPSLVKLLTERRGSAGDVTLPEIESAIGTSCRTAFCFAGWAAVLAGGQPGYVLINTSEGDPQLWLWATGRVHLDGHSLPVSAAAEIALGFGARDEPITEVLGKYRGLFTSDNTLDQLYLGCAAILELDVPALKSLVSARTDELLALELSAANA